MLYAHNVALMSVHPKKKQKYSNGKSCFLNDKIILWNIRVEFPHEAFRPAMCISAVDTSQ